MPPSNPAPPVEPVHSLARAGVPFVIIGGHAVNFHGYVRTTEDTDIVFLRTTASEAALPPSFKKLKAICLKNCLLTL